MLQCQQCCVGGHSGSPTYCILSFVEGAMIPPDPPKLTPHLMFHVQALYDFSIIPPDPPLETDMSHLMSYVQALYDFSMIPPPHPNLTRHILCLMIRLSGCFNVNSAVGQDSAASRRRLQATAEYLR